jgi:uncharacterized membrane protein
MLINLMRSVGLAVVLALSCGVAVSQNNSRQAAEAAKKHRAEKSGLAASGSTKGAAKPTGSVAQRLAACKNTAGWNVIKREECVWNLCKGRWGNDGCPPEGVKTSD